DARFKKYQWITAKIKKDSDQRPESFRVDCESIRAEKEVPPDSMEWLERRQIVLQNPAWQFDSLDQLEAAESQSKRSLGVVIPSEILSVEIYDRPEEECLAWEEKYERRRKKWDADREGWLFDEMMPPAFKDLAFVKNRVQVRWKCAAGRVHN